ncbi:hypothetical protein Avbf_05519 [Armadillidium vulgare]|nr:hypothetical protein Avbf_05519 [Armadillidium vulgare]
MSNPKRSYNFPRIKTVELAPFGNIEIDGDKYPQDLSYSVSTVYCETPEEKWNPSPDIHLAVYRKNLGHVLIFVMKLLNKKLIYVWGIVVKLVEASIFAFLGVGLAHKKIQL